MAKYTSSTSDKSKKTALIVWAVGGLGILGLENFYVGKVKAGLIRICVGIIVIITMAAMKGTEAFVPLCLSLWAVVSLPNFFRLLFGTFRDNVGEPLRK